MRAAMGFTLVGGGLLMMWAVLMGWRLPWEVAPTSDAMSPQAPHTAGPSSEPKHGLTPFDFPFGSTPTTGTGYGGPARLSGIVTGFALAG